MPPLRHRLRRHWQSFREGVPGHRFQDHYHQRQAERRHALWRWLRLGLGFIVMAAGVFFLPAPGPGMLILLVGGRLVAQESLTAARLFDWAEVRLGSAADRGRRAWGRASTAVRVAVVAGAAVVGGGVAYAGYVLVAR